MKNKLKQIYQAWDRIAGSDGNTAVFVFGTVAFVMLTVAVVAGLLLLTIKYAPWVLLVGFIICIAGWLGTLAKLACAIKKEMNRGGKNE